MSTSQSICMVFGLLRTHSTASSMDLTSHSAKPATTSFVSVEYPNLEALAKDTALMRSDADLRAWLEGLGKIRKIVSDSIYEEIKP